jgi:tripartite-type tricarboxylate transporter receptor subunit TctC
VVRSAPDGYTLGFGTLGQYVISGAVYTLPFDMLNDLAPVALLPSVPYWMTARKTLPANNLLELVAWLKVNKASASTVGTASPARFCGMFFQAATGTDFQFVPYRGGAPALQDLVAAYRSELRSGGQSLAQWRNGTTKAYAVMAKTRWSAAPDVPTTDEAGVPGVHVGTRPASGAEEHPAGHRRRINAAAVAAMADPATQPHCRARHGHSAGGTTEPAAFAAYKPRSKWHPIVKAAGVKAE